MNPVSLRSSIRLSLYAGQIIRIEDAQLAVRRERYRVQVLAYTYGFTIGTEHGLEDILTFHWTHERPASNAVARGHLHIGRALLARPTPIRLGDFHNAHVPTGYHSFASAVRFAIRELGVMPLLDDRKPFWPPLNRRPSFPCIIV
jgi:hypothetical protein